MPAGLTRRLPVTESESRVLRLTGYRSDSEQLKSLLETITVTQTPAAGPSLGAWDHPSPGPGAPVRLGSTGPAARGRRLAHWHWDRPHQVPGPEP